MLQLKGTLEIIHFIQPPPSVSRKSRHRYLKCFTPGHSGSRGARTRSLGSQFSPTSSEWGQPPGSRSQEHFVKLGGKLDLAGGERTRQLGAKVHTRLSFQRGGTQAGRCAGSSKGFGRWGHSRGTPRPSHKKKNISFFFFFKLWVYLFIYGCVGSSFLCEGFL